MNRDILDRLLADAERKLEVVLVTDLESGDEQLIYPGGSNGLDAVVLEAARRALHVDTCQTIEHEGRTLFMQPFNLQLRMIIVGAVHIAQPLAAMATLGGWDVVIVDPRQAWATADRFPGIHLSSEWPDHAMTALAPHRRTAVVTLTHDPKLDDPALAAALRSPAFYVGALGSRKTHAERLGRLTAAGFGADELARIHAPIGLDIGATSPAEIAISILAQVTERLHGQ